MAREIFDRVNAEREERGLQPLAWSDALAGVARKWSEEMASRGHLEHQDIGEVLQREELSGFRALGENIFASSGPVPAGTIHAGWMRSDDHRVNVLNPGWDRIGVGVHCADDGSVWASQEFGRTVDADRPPVASSTPPQEPIIRPESTGPTCL
ncbi:CAP domain-containing protein [Geodermatophilus sp. SYSU D01186]